MELNVIHKLCFVLALIFINSSCSTVKQSNSPVFTYKIISLEYNPKIRVFKEIKGIKLGFYQTYELSNISVDRGYVKGRF